MLAERSTQAAALITVFKRESLWEGALDRRRRTSTSEVREQLTDVNVKPPEPGVSFLRPSPCRRGPGPPSGQLPSLMGHGPTGRRPRGHLRDHRDSKAVHVSCPATPSTPRPEP